MRKGFTLIELLVVIAIIAILAAILFPVFAQARDKALGSACQSNLKQMATAMIMYAQDYDERFVPMDTGTQAEPVVPGDTTFCGSTSSYYRSWAALIYPYVRNVELFRCPASSYVCMGVAYGLPTNMLVPGSPNTRITMFGSTTAPAMAALMRPAETLMISEKGSGGGPQYILSGIYYAGRADHNGGCNVAFFDGHVKWMQTKSGPIGNGWPDPYLWPDTPNNHWIHPPLHTFWDPFGMSTAPM